MAQPVPIEISLPITLGQFVKLAGIAGTGGDAKNLIGSGLVSVNSQVEMRRGRKLVPGDVVKVGDHKAEVVLSASLPRSPTVGGQS